MNKKPMLTIAIAAYNEELTLPSLLKDVSLQSEKNYILDKIIVVSDNSTDGTVTNAKKLQLPKLTLVEFPNRRGKSEALDHIIHHTDSDLLLLLDADIRMKNADCIDTIVSSIISNQADIISTSVKAQKSTSFVSSILYTSNIFKRHLIESWNNGNNIYTCHGRCICMTKKLFKKINYKGIIADDALAYLTAIKLGYLYRYIKNVYVTYKLPQTIQDHSKQSSRFLQSQKQLRQLFNSTFVKKEYFIPLHVMIPRTLEFLIKHPLSMTLYLLMFISITITSLTNSRSKAVWDIATSSKI